MKATGKDYLQLAQRGGAPMRVSFLCGQDEAGAAAAADKLVALLPHAGERVELSGGELRSDPVRLGDEARSSSLFGTDRYIRVRCSGDEAHDAVANLLALVDGGEADGACPVIIVATNASDKSRTAKLLIPRKDALAVMFYPPDLRSVTAEVARMAAGAGLKLSPELAERIARGAALDLRLCQSEVDKLALYLDASPLAPRLADGEALDAIGARTEEDGFMPLVNAVLGGDTQRLPAELARMAELELNPVGVLLAIERRAAQLAQLTARAAGGGQRIADLLENEQRARRVFWRDRADLERQMQRWDAGRLDRLVSRLAGLHRTLLANSAAAPLLLAQDLAEITRFASTRR
ncbi:DNA polymerase III subunit delta [Croceibacterium mercuriale]|uniref:DNA-directed DNA polymerase n=1 Tax=Croceibacterium mercuriale TaxID=1572751 RepID=A0A0B2BTS8_9SPHN|nr:DNA polymerase III subunit delta [Croceibacterium mercuriale]KHL24834.1 DNA polymerase III subunit delta [Croceibacterium mercuriale]